MDQPKEPAGDVLFDLYKLVANSDDVTAMAAKYRAGGFGYGEVKKALADAAAAFFGEVRERRADIADRPEEVREVLAVGAARARERAGEVLRRAEEACGLSSPLFNSPA